MSKVFSAKTFKSGNSVALRLPAALGVQPGREMLIAGDADSFAVKRSPEPKRKMDLTGVWGAAPGIGACMPESRDFKERPSALEVRRPAGG